MEHKCKPTAEQVSPNKVGCKNFKTIEAMGLKLFHRGTLEYHYLVPNFMKIYQVVQKLLVGDRQTAN
jgi:hypothetical protein